MPTTIRIIKRGNIKCTVVPAHVFLNPLDRVVFHAMGADMVVLIPDDIFTETEHRFEVLDGQTSSEKEIKTGAQGVHPYAVYCADHQDFAEGNSPPTMIVL